MDRGATAAWVAALVAKQSSPFHLLEVHFDAADGGVVRFCDAYRNITFNGNLYTAAGYLLEFSDIDESSELGIHEVTVSLSGVDQSQISVILTKKYLGRTLKIFKGFWTFSSPDTIEINPIPIFEGEMDAPSIEDDSEAGRSIVSVTASNEWADFERRPGRHTNHQEQQTHFPGDLIFQYTHDQNQEVVWGGTG